MIRTSELVSVITCRSRYRFYYQPFEPEVHLVSEPRVSWGIGASGGHAEYDVPQCADGTPVDECKHTIWVRRPWNPFRRRRPF
jgi:hypothetical protein